jgi:hypothetical protein
VADFTCTETSTIYVFFFSRPSFKYRTVCTRRPLARELSVSLDSCQTETYSSNNGLPLLQTFFFIISHTRSHSLLLLLLLLLSFIVYICSCIEIKLISIDVERRAWYIICFFFFLYLV